MSAQCIKTKKDYLCHTVGSYIEVPLLHFSFPSLYGWLLIYNYHIKKKKVRCLYYKTTFIL